MILLTLTGGFGNQIFQYAYARYVARELDAELWLNGWFYTEENPLRRRGGYSEGNHNSQKLFELQKYNILCDRLCEDDWRDEDDLLARHPSMRLVLDNGRHVSEVAALGDNLILGGEFSSHTDYLFEPEYRRILLEELTPKRPPSGTDYANYMAAIEASENPVAVHVRRGDYVRLQRVFRLLGASFYDAAFRRIEAAVPNPDYFVFSDDIECVRNEGLLSGPATFVETGDLVANFELTRACRHIICANSTYSWWAAYGIRHQSKVVIMPAEYYNHEAFQAQYERMGAGFSPPEWLKV